MTIRDVAERAGVSTAAVSYVLNGKSGKVSPKTRQHIERAIEELNYVPDFSARSLVSNKSNLIGVVIPQNDDRTQTLFDNPFYGELVGGIELVLRQQGYHMILSAVEQQSGYLDVSLQRNLDGAIILGIMRETLFEDLLRLPLPTVLVDSYIEDNRFVNIQIDDELGGYMATLNLIERGHRRIAMVTGEIHKDGVMARRHTGYCRALHQHQLPYDRNLVLDGVVHYNFGVQAGRSIAKQFPDVTAVFASGDQMAFGVINGLSEFGVTVPDDVSVIGFDDIQSAQMFHPPLTTIRQDIFGKGKLAAESLIRLIDGQARRDEVITLPLQLVERKTVKSIRIAQ